MALGVGRGMTIPLLFLNLAMYLVVLGIAGWAMNNILNGTTTYLNNITYTFLIFALIAGVVGVAACFAGFFHLSAWRTDSLAASASSALIAWALTLLAFGLACKQINSLRRGPRMKALESFVIILAGTQLVYLLLLHAGLVSSQFGPGFRGQRPERYGEGGTPRESKAAAATAAVV